MVTDYLDIIDKIRPVAEENGHKEEIDRFLADSRKEHLAHSRHRDGTHRTREGLLEGRFKIDKIRRVEMKPFKDASGLKALDFSKNNYKRINCSGL